MSRRVYLDHNASTPVHPEVLAEMLPFFAEIYGNPSSIHAFGRDARDGVDQARERIARFLQVSPQEIVFTSGGTESDNLGVKGLASARGRGHLITSSVEHHAVLRTCQVLEAQGFDVTYVGVDAHGMVDPDEVRHALRPDTIAISVMHAEAERVAALRDRLWEGVRARVPEVRLSGHPTERLPGTASLLVRHVESESIVLGLDLKGIAVSAGSACTSGNVEPSHVLVAMGVPLDWAMGAVRCSLGRSTTAEDVDYVIESVDTVVRRLRQALPVGAA